VQEWFIWRSWKDRVSARVPRVRPVFTGRGVNTPRILIYLETMFYVYILLSLKDKNFYIGVTEELKQRFTEHQQGKVKSTKNRLPLRLLCYEVYTSKHDAGKREKYLKSNDGRKELRIRLKDTLEKLL